MTKNNPHEKENPMSNIVIDTLKSELKRKQARVDKLEKLMSEKHLKSVDAKAMDSYAKKCNNAESTKDKLKVIEEWKSTSDRWNKSIAKLKHQTKNYTKWMDEQFELQSDCMELSNQISTLEFRNSMRG